MLKFFPHFAVHAGKDLAGLYSGLIYNRWITWGHYRVCAMYGTRVCYSVYMMSVQGAKL